MKLYYLSKQRNGNDTIGRIRLSLSIVNASTNVDMIRLIKTNEKLLYVYMLNILELCKVRKTISCEKNIKNEPWMDFLEPGNLCFPYLEPTKEANESPTPTEIKPLS